MNNPETLIELLSEYTVEIPKIQRDYVQGRMDEDITIVRDKLLDDMKRAILGKVIDENTGIVQMVRPLDLNFVYGKKENNKFIPLDGQQRLTTLFLLHLYAYANDASKTELLNRFTYETRISSREFLKCITKYRESIFKSNERPSIEIKDAPWFLSSWKYDPTIQSALVMLDEIKQVFHDVNNLAERLECEEKPLTFRFKDIEELGMEDSLYIKLNARGKPLTSFENFKSQFIGRVDELEITEDEKNEFMQKFDGVWTDVIWKGNEENFDKTFLNFFEILFINHGMIANEILWWSKFNYKNLTSDLFYKVTYLLDFVSDKNQSQELKDFVLSPIRKREKPTYSERVLFHGLTVFLYRAQGQSSLGDLNGFMRIIKNLVVNSTIDREELYSQAIKQVDKLSKHWKDLTSYFTKNNITISFFNREQIEEEKIKAKIIQSSPSFADKIYSAEKNNYFRGQVRAALYLSKVNHTYDEALFEDYWSKIELLFNVQSTEDTYNLLRQALLTFGDYRLTVASYYKTLCITDPYENSRTPSLRTLFSQHGDIVKQLLDCLDTTSDIHQQLEKIIQSSKVQENDWRYCIIHSPANMKKMSLQHLRMRKSNGNWIMVPNKASNGYNYDLYLNTLLLKIQENCSPAYTWLGEYGTDVERYLHIDRIGVDIYFEQNHFVLYKKNKEIYSSPSETPMKDTYQYLKTNFPKYIK